MTHDFQNGRCVKCQVSLETFNERWGMVACVPSVDVSWNASPVECVPQDINALSEEAKKAVQQGIANLVYDQEKQQWVLDDGREGNTSPCLKEANEEIMKEILAWVVPQIPQDFIDWFKGEIKRDLSEAGYNAEAFDVTFTPFHFVLDDNSTQEPPG